jgi:D-alanine-D-alanine ligase
VKRVRPAGKPRRILVLMHEDLVPPDKLESAEQREDADWKTEYDVVTGLRRLKHEVRKLGVASDLGVIRDAILDWSPDIAFNVLEEFHGVAVYDHHVISYLELMRKPYTGCNPRGLLLSHDKALAKTLLSYHRIRVPDFVVFPKGQRVRRPRRLAFPLMVKSTIEEGSLGISQASIVTSDEKLAARVEFIHGTLATDAIAEQYIEGRELYVGVIGNRRLQTFPVWEMCFNKMPEGVARIATSKVKWDRKYQKKNGIETVAAQDLPSGVEEQIVRICKRVYRILGISGYARMDLRLTPDGKIYLIEANPNPNIAHGEDFAESAAAIDISYEALLHRIVNLGLSYQAEWKG